MKLNLPLLKFITRLLSLLILIVILFLVSSFLYTAKYWPDVYNYINANITIKRIHSISELNLTIIRIDSDYTTEGYFTTEPGYTDMTTDIYGADFTDTFEDFFAERRRRDVKIEETNKDYNELPVNVVINYYFMDEPTTEIIRDSVDESKLTTRDGRDVEMVIGVVTDRKFQEMTNPNCSGASIATAISWIATIFVKNDSNNQFEYYCDGVLLSNSIVLTAARCVNITKSPITNAENYIVILGKRSLQTARGDERVYRVKQIILHENFTVRESGMVNDLAMLVLDEPVVFGRTIRAACVGFETPVESFTTGWGFSGNLTAILFDEGRRTDCKRNTLSEKTFCGIYGKDVSVCPSYGGMYVTRQADNRWALQGLRTADTSNRGFCIDKSVTFTALSGYSDWINEKLENYRY